MPYEDYSYYPGISYHTHGYEGITSFNDGHSHFYGGITSFAPSGVPHVHYIQGVTAFNDFHVHSYYYVTSPSIPTGDGGHTHYFYGPVKYAKGHFHYAENYTTID